MPLSLRSSNCAVEKKKVFFVGYWRIAVTTSGCILPPIIRESVESRIHRRSVFNARFAGMLLGSLGEWSRIEYIRELGDNGHI